MLTVSADIAVDVRDVDHTIIVHTFDTQLGVFGCEWRPCCAFPLHMMQRGWTTRQRVIARRSLSSSALRALATKPSQQYEQLVALRILTLDRAQLAVVQTHLDKLQRRLDGYTLPTFKDYEREDEDKEDRKETHPDEKVAKRASQVMVPRGLYLYGSVGTGKSMLMDLFFANVNVQRKRRVHFNKFMLDVHERLQRERQKHLQLYGRQRNIDLSDPRKDVITIVAEQLADENHLLCFDEFQVTDIADALIMRKLFGVFFNKGVVMVATSNTSPKNLYHDGTNREYFMPFLDQLTRHTKVVNINSETDYRMLSEPFGEATFLYPLTEATNSKLLALYRQLIPNGDKEEEDLRIPVMMGRHLHVRGSRTSGVCMTTFNHLCNTEKGAADYKALCECFHTLVLVNVPVLRMKQHDQARRFILLIDELYEHRTRLIWSAEVPAHQIFQFDEEALVVDEQTAKQAETQATKQKNEQQALQERNIPVTSSWDSAVGAYNPAKMAGLQIQNLCALQDLKVAFKRAVSRIQEMQSEKYLNDNQQQRHQRLQNLHNILS